MSLKTETENTISSGVDEVGRRIFFGRYLPNADADVSDDFDHVSVEYAVRAIIKMVSDNAKKPIEIHMNSCGGNPYSMMYLHDVILSCPCQVKFFGGGAIMSAATWIMAACDERYLYPNATVMVHNGFTGFENSVTDAEIWMAEERRLMNLLIDIYAKNSRMPKEFWVEICKRDTYMTAQETVMLGLADKVIETKRRGNFRKMRQTHLNENIHHAKMKKVVNSLYERIQSKIQIKDIHLNSPVQEQIDETLTIEENNGGNNVTTPGPTAASGTIDGSASGTKT